MSVIVRACKIQPFLAKDCVPAPADELIHDDQDPNCEMIDLRVHENLRDYAGVRSSIANRLARDCSLAENMRSGSQLSTDTASRVERRS